MLTKRQKTQAGTTVVRLGGRSLHHKDTRLKKVPHPEALTLTRWR